MLRSTYYVIGWLALSAGGGCQTSSQAGEQGADARQPAGAAANLRRPAELTPALISKSEEVLQEHRDEPVGSEFEVEVEGRRYIARLEMHEDAEKGKHKGVTLYAAE